jgi:serine/threonine protein kinase
LIVGENNIVKMFTYGLNLKIGKTGFELESVAKTTYDQGSELKVDEDAFYYWSPELYNDKPLDARSDIYSLGVVFYNLATKKYPLGDFTGIAYLNKLDNAKAFSTIDYNSYVPKEVDEIILKMVEANPDNRYQSAKELLDVMSTYMSKRSNDIRFEKKNYIAKAFIAMPFAKEFDLVFDMIESVCEENLVKAVRVDNLIDIDNIWYAILREISDCEFTIADFSGDKYKDVANCNVVTEAAHARTIGKPVILLSQHPEYMFFDWRTQHAIKYELDEDLSRVKKSLSRKIIGCLKYLEKLA